MDEGSEKPRISLPSETKLGIFLQREPKCTHFMLIFNSVCLSRKEYMHVCYDDLLLKPLFYGTEVELIKNAVGIK